VKYVNILGKPKLLQLRVVYKSKHPPLRVAGQMDFFSSLNENPTGSLLLTVVQPSNPSFSAKLNHTIKKHNFRYIPSKEHFIYIYHQKIQFYSYIPFRQLLLG